jgi:hypothetical protein
VKTILQSGLTQKTISSAELNPLVAVADNHLLVNTRPSRFGVFNHAGAGELPSIASKQFRITNSGSSTIAVTQKTPLLIRTFDNSIDVSVDSDTIRLDAVDSYTPNGESAVLRITHAGDSAAYESVETTESFFGVQAYFKINSIGWTNSSDPDFAIKPFGIYTNKQAIDTNLPALSLGVGLDTSDQPKFRIFTGNIADESLPTAVLDRWYRVNLEATASSSEFVVSLNVENPALSGQWSQVYTTNITSTGPGMLDEIFAQNSFVVGMSSDGIGSQDIESLFVYRDIDGEEELLPSTTKEYFCIHNLDEYRVSGSVTGYYTS